MIEPLAYGFMQRAILAGVFVAFAASYFAPFVVQRRMAFLGSGLAHASFAGVALGVLAGVGPLWLALPYTVAVAVAMVWVRNRTDLAADTTIGVFFALSMALGIVLLNLKPGYVQETIAILFGSILAVDAAALAVAAATALATLATLPVWKRWAYATFDPDLARSDRQPVTRDDYLLTIAIALVVVASIRVVGIVLIAAFLVLPAATARLLSRTFTVMTLLSIAIGVTTAVAGLYISYYADLPSGPAIVLLQGVLFGVALVVHHLRA